MAQIQLADLLKQGIKAKKNGDAITARLLFSRALQMDPQNENGWLWLASVAESPQQAQAMLERILEINPHNEKAQQLLQQLRFKVAPKGKVLVVDGNITVRNLVTITLQRQGFEVVQAADGMEALERLKQAIPDLVLIDVNMPHLDGYQLCRTIRAQKETNHIPVLMLSDSDGFFDRVKGRIAGATDYITKPFAPLALIAAVKRQIPNGHIS